jgi:hypothetical protein
MAVVLAYVCFVPIAALCFARLPLRSAILLVLIGGWWALPVARYGPGAPGTLNPWWITGIALPSDMLLTKAWIPPLAAFAGAAVRGRDALKRWRPAWIDLPMAAWCVWPLFDGLGGGNDPPSWVSALYVTGAWGLPWLIGRVWFEANEGRLAVARAVALSGLANLPVALVEAFRPGWFYGLLYGPHPFRFDGVDRYVGHRPIGFFENGNLYGLWAALAAFAALALLRNREVKGRRWVALAAINVAIALASQSVGAIILLGIGLALLAIWRLPAFLPLLAGAAVLLLLAAAVHFSGLVPVQSLARTPAGERVIGAMRGIGRGSLLWRVSQDSKTLATIAAHPIGGTGQWDWWRPYRTRPWGQATLLLGQYGIIGLLLAWGALIAACAAALVRRRQSGDRLSNDPALPLAIMVLLALADAGLNAFFFFPAILAAGAIAGSRKRWR